MLAWRTLTWRRRSSSARRRCSASRAARSLSALSRAAAASVALLLSSALDPQCHEHASLRRSQFASDGSMLYARCIAPFHANL